MRFARLGALATFTLAFFATPLAVEAQHDGRVPRIGALVAVAPGFAPIEGFRQGLRDLGYVEGGNIVVEYQYAAGKAGQYRDLAVEMVRREPDIIVVWGTELAQAVRQATPTIPIVMALGDRPIEMGLVADLAHPGGTLTGLTTMNFELGAKHLELLKEILPKLTRVAVLYAPDPRVEPTLKELTVAAQTLGIRLEPLEARGVQDLERAFAAMARERAGALLLMPGALQGDHGARVADLALKHRLPTITQGKSSVLAGALMAYGANPVVMARRAATFVDKILKGAKPADLPIEQPTKFDLVVNLKTAKALGLTIPPSVLARADELIQ